ncbi:hypothetical protein [Nannocystis sp. SCPEA4]|nr:hypothetical protein [Nannocystis sp. SCPEA4]MCY1061764.1 hypothetical protein [Nannocystis sp. SCPEA4]
MIDQSTVDNIVRVHPRSHDRPGCTDETRRAALGLPFRDDGPKG